MGRWLVRQIAKSLRGDEGAQPVEQILSDALAGKSLSTLRARASSLMAFGRWKKGLDPLQLFFQLQRNRHMLMSESSESSMRQERSQVGFLEAVAFAFHMLGAEVDGTMSSPRVKGAVVVPVVIPKKKEPLTVKQIAFLENLAIDDSGQLGIFAGYCCMVLHMRLRWMDGQFCQQEPILDLFEGKASSDVAFIITRMLEDRNTHKGSFQQHATFPASLARTGRQTGSIIGSYMA